MSSCVYGIDCQDLSELEREATAEHKAGKLDLPSIDHPAGGRGKVTAFWYCCHKGFVAGCQLLHKFNVDIYKKDELGWTPFFAACDSGQADVVRWLAEVGADINDPRNDGWTPFLRSCKVGQLEIVTYLVSIGADIERPTVGGQTAMQAAKSGFGTDVADFLSSAECKALAATGKDVFIQREAQFAGRVRRIMSYVVPPFVMLEEEADVPLSAAAGGGGLMSPGLLLSPAAALLHASVADAAKVNSAGAALVSPKAAGDKKKKAAEPAKKPAAASKSGTKAPAKKKS